MWSAFTSGYGNLLNCLLFIIFELKYIKICFFFIKTIFLLYFNFDTYDNNDTWTVLYKCTSVRKETHVSLKGINDFFLCTYA